MKRRLATICTAGALAFTGVACGGDDAGGGGGGSVQNQVADELLSEIDDDDDVGVDEGCVRRVTGELSDADARALLDNDEESFSAEGIAVMSDLLECVDVDLGDLGDLDTDG